MTYSRYDSRNKFKNNLDQFKEHFDKRDIKFIMQYVTPKFGHINQDSMINLQIYTHIWKGNDKLYKLAHEHYNDSKLWWVIAWFNKKPTESHFKIGDKVFIPKNLNKLLEIMGV
jgi:nucleoid-associated protein YgaU